MTVGTALVFAYGVVAVALLTYVTRLWQRLHRMEHSAVGSSARVVTDR